jgi:hypothetical protein
MACFLLIFGYPPFPIRLYHQAHADKAHIDISDFIAFTYSLHRSMISAQRNNEAPMIRYADLNGNSGVVAYRCGRDWMDVKFVDGQTYRYDFRSAGIAAIRRMKLLAALGSGLATYINQHAHDRYLKRLP